jgi:hypothetical protein
MADIPRPLLVGGERLRKDAPNRKGRSKDHRFTYAEAKAALQPQAVQIREAARATKARTKEFVFRATLWPDYLAASYFPETLLQKSGIDVVGWRAT